MDIKPYSIGSDVLVDGFNFDEFVIEGYLHKITINKGEEIYSILYTVRSKKNFVCQVDHAHIKLKNNDDSSDIEIKEKLPTDELLQMYQNYKELYEQFGDNEYLNKLLEIELVLKNKKSNRSDTYD